MSVRTELAEMFETDWAEIPELSELRVIATERPLDDPDEPVAVIRMRSFGRNAAAPNSHRDYGFSVLIVSKYADPDSAAEELDAFGAAVLDYLGPRMKHDTAEFAAWSESRMALSIPFTAIAANAAQTP